MILSPSSQRCLYSPRRLLLLDILREHFESCSSYFCSFCLTFSYIVFRIGFDSSTLPCSLPSCLSVLSSLSASLSARHTISALRLALAAFRVFFRRTSLFERLFINEFTFLRQKQGWKELIILVIRPMLDQSSITGFIPLSRIGEGSFSSVYKVKRVSDGNIYALKKIKIGAMKEKERANALNEIRILASISSEYIVGYKAAFFDEKLSLLCIVMDWASGGDLLHLINDHRQSSIHVREAVVWKAALQISRGLHLLHSKSILHRDLKSANVFVEAGCFKIGDLNVSKVNHHQMAYTQTGTPYYASPEIWRDQPYDAKSDIWSLGCILYELCALHPPFQADKLPDLYQQVQKGLFQPIPKLYSLELKQLIHSCLSLTPKDRPAAQALIHPNGLICMKCREHRIDLGQELVESAPLLKTIQVPRDLRQLKKNLPESKYQVRGVQKRVNSCSTPKRQTVLNPQAVSLQENVEVESIEKISSRKPLQPIHPNNALSKISQLRKFNQGSKLVKLRPLSAVSAVRAVRAVIPAYSVDKEDPQELKRRYYRIVSAQSKGMYGGVNEAGIRASRGRMVYDEKASYKPRCQSALLPLPGNCVDDLRRRLESRRHTKQRNDRPDRQSKLDLMEQRNLLHDIRQKLKAGREAVLTVRVRRQMKDTYLSRKLYAHNLPV